PGGLRPVWGRGVAGSYTLSLRAAPDAGIAIRVAFVPGLDLGGVLSFRIDSLSATSAGNFCLAGRLAAHHLGRKDWSVDSRNPVCRGSRRFAGTADLGLLACRVAHPGGRRHLYWLCRQCDVFGANSPAKDQDHAGPRLKTAKPGTVGAYEPLVHQPRLSSVDGRRLHR